jgi:hypothetical protein
MIALISALCQSKAWRLRGVWGKARVPITTAAMPNGMLIANRYGQVAVARMVRFEG